MFITDKILFLRELPIFNGLNKSELAAIANICILNTFQPGETVHSKGSIPQRLSLPLAGTLQLVDDVEKNEEVSPLALGIASLLCATPLVKKCIASKGSGFKCLQIKKSNFFSIIHECPELLINFMKLLPELDTAAKNERSYHENS